MHDIRLIRENTAHVKHRRATRGGDAPGAMVDEVLSIDTRRRAAETEALGEAWAAMCPAKVYEVVEESDAGDGMVRVHMDPSNCVQCGAITAKGGITLDAVGAISLPVFWFGLLLQLGFANGLGWFPSSGRATYGVDSVGDRLAHLVLPAIVLAVVHAAAWSRYLRGSMREVLALPFVRAARARGADAWRVVVRHALRNAAVRPYMFASFAHSWELHGTRAWLVAFLTFAAGGATDSVPGGVALTAALILLLGPIASVSGNELALRYGRARIMTIGAAGSGLLSLVFGTEPESLTKSMAFDMYLVGGVAISSWDLGALAATIASSAGSIVVGKVLDELDRLGISECIKFIRDSTFAK